MNRFHFFGRAKSKQFFFYCFVIILFLFSTFVLFFRLDSYPQGLYNWENYSIWRIFQREQGKLEPPLDNYLSLTQGLMTDSGLSPFIGIPVGFLFDIASADLYPLRVWNASLGVATIILFLLLTKKLFGLKVTVFSSLYLLAAPAFLLYMRTATNVGISLFFSLITFYLLYLIWKEPQKLKNYLFLIVSLWINSYLYGPIRFLLVLAVVLLVGKYVYTFKHKLKINKRTIAFFLLIPVFGLLIFKTTPLVTNAIALYFHGRGEQIFTQYAESETLQEQGITSVIPIITKNAIDLGKLYFNINTKPAITDYWNPQGQLITSSLVPFFLLGLGLTIRRVKTPQYFLLLLWFGITSLPIIFTNNVHIGRLIFSLPPLFIFVGIGFAQLLTLSAKIFPYKALLYVLVGCIVVVSLFFEVSSYFSEKPVPDNYVSRDTLRTVGIGDTDIYLFNVDTESLRFWTAYFYLHNDYKFVDLENPEREIIGNKDAAVTIYFIEEGATLENILHYCTQNPLPVLLAGHPDQTFLTLPCKNRIMQI